MRLLKWLPVVVVLGLIIIPSSLWGHRVIAENLAHSSYNSSWNKLQSDLHSARTDGLFPSELQPYRSSLKSIESKSPPQDGSLFSTSTGSFYDRQSQRLNTLDQHLRSLTGHITLAARRHARWTLWKFGQEISSGHQSGLPLTKQAQMLSSDRLNLSKASTAGQYRAISGNVQPQLTAIKALVSERQADMKRINSAIQNSSDPLSMIQGLIRSKTSAANAQLSTLGLFAKTAGFSRWLSHLSSWALSQKSTHEAAIGLADVDALGIKIHQKLSSATPAKWILVSTEGEWIQWYQNGSEIGSSLATTGNPALPTVKGHFTILAKFSPFEFKSPFPVGSPYWYAPSWTNWAMEFQDQGYYIHDAPWRSAFGPGTDGAGTPGTNYGGTHGCVNVPSNVAQFLFGWAPIGTPVIVV